MPNVRMAGPDDVRKNAITVNGRRYIYTVGTVVTVPDFDAVVLEANGWMALLQNVGTTAQRPSIPKRGETYNDTTTGGVLRYSGPGLGWVHVASGAVNQ